MSSPSIKYLNTLEEFNLNLDQAGDKLVVIDFTANWCGPCKGIAPYLETLASQYTECHFYKVDVDIGEEIAAAYRVNAMPTFVFLKDRKEMVRFSGADQNRLVSILEAYCG